VFKVYVHVPGSDNARKTKKLETRDINEAIKQAMEFERQVKTGHYKNEIKVEVQPKNSFEEGNKTPHLLIHALARYVGWLNNEDVPEHLVVERSSDHLKDIERKLELLLTALKHKGYDLSSLRIDQINDKTVGDVYKYLSTETNYSSRTFNRHFSYYSSFLKWFSEEYYPVKAWFKRVNLKPVTSNPQAITKEEYDALLRITTPENGIQEYESGVKKERNFYRPYLVHAFRLALETGRRRAELINMKFNGITEESDGSGYIKVEDFKVNHIQKRTTEETKKYIYVPLTDSLRQLLNEMGYEKYKGTDNYILAPEIKSKRNKVMADLLSRSFTHYYKKLNTGRELTFKSFRKAYITNLSLFMRGNTKAITGHTTDEVIEKHYQDKIVLAKAMQRFNVFSNEERLNELQQIRKETETNHKSQEISK
jgi:integrase